jgi:hypothetical protein
MALFRLQPLALAAAVAALVLPAAAHADWQRGVDFTTYSAATYGTAPSDASLARAAASGNDSVSIVVTQYMDNATSSSIRANGATPTDAALLHAMRTAHALGLNVNLKPHVDLVSGAWVGTIAPASPDAWFASYEAMIDHYADLARQGGAKMLVIGTELKTMTGSANTARWESIIAGVRQHFSGSLTYAANWNEYQQVQFWANLDYIGVDAYFPLSDAPDPSVASLLAAWTSRGYVEALRTESQAFGKQVLFTEIGYRSIVGAAIHPNIWNSQADYDMSEETNAYEAAFQAFAGRSWFAGMYWWSWPASLPLNGWNGDYTPTFKGAEDVMRSWNAKLAGTPGPAPVQPSPVAATPTPAAAPQPVASPPAHTQSAPVKKAPERKSSHKLHRKPRRRPKRR